MKINDWLLIAVGISHQSYQTFTYNLSALIHIRILFIDQIENYRATFDLESLDDRRLQETPIGGSKFLGLVAKEFDSVGPIAGMHRIVYAKPAAVHLWGRHPLGNFIDQIV